MSIWSWDGIVPVVDPAAFVHPDATLIGDVIVAAGAYVGPQCVLRGDSGRVEIGEASVVIAVSATHRHDALAACQDAIDALKETVPLWKKEVYEGGEEWVGRGS